MEIEKKLHNINQGIIAKRTIFYCYAVYPKKERNTFFIESK